ncbi:4-alpha-glucanotransferase [Pseudorhodoferax sp. Leaf267]|uniref:4-alpha-glucanotransferase n=1 Tax=Pseudorhodoferax sp. Leaf267 TaxID=1736316 RepID=UPI0007000EDB|nr:4-alpha-glucanotransferase [Pseudorhodoferax sp. Leaf267]KQP19767.1 4-alpha-glucanotransferase [Pseudorhodoferax sp. Leaf267]
MRLPRASGILLHPTSLPGPHGSGDLGPSAYHFVDWLQGAGQKLWQILPLGGVGPGNSPYMSSSAFAGNVLLIDLADLAAQGWLVPDDLAPDAAFQDARIDYGALIPWRMARLARAADAFAVHASAEQRADHAAFCADHAAWLDDYALFMALAEEHPGRDWADWPAPLARREPAALRDAAEAHAGRIAFWRFGQWCFFRQWQRLRAYANARGIAIVGDAPIFIAPQSADVWAHQQLFELDADGRQRVVAGVPPDYFSATGQRWGNPLYRWSAHAADGYAWWTERVRHTFKMVDIVRIDHFRGFAAYWEIPASEPTAVQGRWLPGPGLALFEAIAEALGPLPIIAEDLGLITPDVDALRRATQLPGMRILHFAFDGKADNLYLPHNHEAPTVVYTGTHDNDTTQGWWATASEAERNHVGAYLDRAPDTLAPEIHWTLIRMAWASVADTAIAPLQDVLGLGTADRMNLPGEGHGHWAWRFGWDQVRPEHAERLAALTRLYGRAAASVSH